MTNASNPEVRKTGIGGSDISVILGLNPWKTPLGLYLEKRGEIEPDNLDDVEVVQWGNKLEAIIALEYARKTGRKVRRNNQTLRHPDHVWMMAHLDREIVGTFDGLRGGLECKNTSEYQGSNWGDEYTDDFPAHYRAQVLWYMAITGKDFFDLAVLIGGNKHRIYRVFARDVQKETAEMIEAGRKFWEGVMGGRPPAPVCSDDLLLIHPTDTTEEALATDTDLSTASQLITTKEEIKRLKAVQTDLEFLLKESTGDASSLKAHTGQVIATWKASETRRHDTARFKEECPELAKKYTKTTTSRTFRINPKTIGELCND